MEVSFYGNKLVEKNISEFLEPRINYSNLSRGEKKIALEKLIRGCKNCKLCYETKFKPIPSILNVDSFAVFIGRSPCGTEAQENKLFPQASRLGKIFDYYLSAAGLSNSEVSVLNMANCYTTGNRPPEQEVVNICVSYKRFEFDVIGDKFKVLFLMGNDAMRWVFGLKSSGVLQNLGKTFYIDLKGRRVLVVPVLHPNHLLIQPEYKDAVAKVLKAVRPLIQELRNTNG